MSIKIYDQLGLPVQIEKSAIRIVCLVPSITELLYDLGLKNQIVGRTKFCVLPADLKSIPQIGGTKQINIDKIKDLNPDLIIANKEENTEEIVESLKSISPIYISNIQTIHGSANMIHDIGILTNKEREANILIDQLESIREQWHKQVLVRRKCLYLIWKDPYMTIGVDTFIFHMLQEMGLESVLYDVRYPQITEQYIKESEAKYILLSSEPYPFKQKHIDELKTLFPTKKIIWVDGTYFSWYGSRLIKAYSYFNQLNLSLLNS